MPIAANIRLAPAATDPTAAQPDGAAPAEVFGELISGLAEASAEGAVEGASPAAPEAAVTHAIPAAGDSDVAETVEQLLALACSPHAGAKSAEASGDPAEIPTAPEDPAPGQDVAVPQAVAPFVPAISPLVQPRPVEQPTRVETPMSPLGQQQLIEAPAPDIREIDQPTQSQPQITVTQPAAQIAKTVSAETEIVAPQGRAVGRDLRAAAVPTAGQEPVEAPQIASSRTEAVVQLALSSLEAAVRSVPAQPWAMPSKAPARRSGDSEPTIALPELKLTPAMVLASANPVAAAFESLRPAEAVQIGTPPASQPLGAGELAIEHQLDMAHEGEWLDQLARDITRSAGSDGSPLRFRLNPENLGSLRVEITQDRGGAAVRLTTDTEAARTIIAEAQPRLIAEARAQGIRISEAHVDLGGQTASGDPRRQNAAFEEAPLRTARSLQDQGEGDGKPTPDRSERYA